MAPPGWKLVEADYSQAELFVLSHVSGDANMIKLLTTPGKDMHSQTAIDAFSLEVLDEKLEPVDDDYAVKFATEDLKAFEDWQDTWHYREQNGNVITQAKFKKGSRQAAKSVTKFALYKPIELLETCNLHNHNVTGNGKRDGLKICRVGQSAAKILTTAVMWEYCDNVQRPSKACSNVEASRVGVHIRCTSKRWGCITQHDMVQQEFRLNTTHGKAELKSRN